MPRIITITSGKGGVGKTNISLNTALYLASQGQRTCLFDADLGLANINILLGLQPEHTLKDLVLDGRELQQILIKDFEGIDILPGSSGIEELANLAEEKTFELVESLAGLHEYDFLLFDTSAGISKNVISFCLAAPEVVVIITPEPTSLTDAYSLVKVLCANEYQGKLEVIINLCKDFATAKSVYAKFRGAVQKYLGLQVQALGVVFDDTRVTEAVKQQKPLLINFPNSPASQCIRKIGEKLLQGGGEELQDVEIGSFWRRWWKAVQAPLKLKDSGNNKQSASPPSRREEEDQKEVSQPPAPPVTTQKQEPESDKGVAKKDTPIIEELAKGLAAVSEELRLIRSALERNGNPEGDGRGSGGGFLSHGGPKIKLDLQAYLRTKGGVDPN
ncbi:MAG: hypothetical protein DRH15_03795 [Deltaproteobacteria bacterium]|nr:MAG: hypothetical protein DRH15_03795 [Deltaproteobacteria bacterium]